MQNVPVGCAVGHLKQPNIFCDAKQDTGDVMSSPWRRSKERTRLSVRFCSSVLWTLWLIKRGRVYEFCGNKNETV